MQFPGTNWNNNSHTLDLIKNTGPNILEYNGFYLIDESIWRVRTRKRQTSCDRPNVFSSPQHVRANVHLFTRISLTV